MAKRPPRHNRDHAHKQQRPDACDEVIEKQLTALLTPAIDAQASYYRHLGLRNRILSLPLMVAAVLSLLWRNVPSVHELCRMLAREDLLWCQAVEISQQSLAQRFLEFPAELFERVFLEVLPCLQQRWQQRQKRPLPESIQWAHQTFEQLWIADGSTLEQLFRKLNCLQHLERAPLAGKIVTVIDLVTRLPVQIWFSHEPQRPDAKFEADLLALVSAKTLLLLDRGFYHFQFFADLIAQQVDFITRLKAKAHYQVVQELSHSYGHQDQVILLGHKRKHASQVRLRLIQVCFGQTWYCYLTSVLDPEVLSPLWWLIYTVSAGGLRKRFSR
jgi:hypothetical protein